jgi:class 3 adenylate cyclase
MSETRKIAAIVVADVVGYSQLASVDEDRTLARLRALRSDLIDPTIAVHHGRVVKCTGDGFVSEFRSVVDAARCAVEVQTGMVECNAGVAPDRRIGGSAPCVGPGNSMMVKSRSKSTNCYSVSLSRSHDLNVRSTAC